MNYNLEVLAQSVVAAFPNAALVRSEAQPGVERVTICHFNATYTASYYAGGEGYCDLTYSTLLTVADDRAELRLRRMLDILQQDNNHVTAQVHRGRETTVLLGIELPAARSNEDWQRFQVTDSAYSRKLSRILTPRQRLNRCRRIANRPSCSAVDAWSSPIFDRTRGIAYKA